MMDQNSPLAFNAEARAFRPRTVVEAYANVLQLPVRPTPPPATSLAVTEAAAQALQPVQHACGTDRTQLAAEMAKVSTALNRVIGQLDKLLGRMDTLLDAIGSTVPDVTATEPELEAVPDNITYLAVAGPDGSWSVTSTVTSSITTARAELAPPAPVRLPARNLVRLDDYRRPQATTVEGAN